MFVTFFFNLIISPTHRVWALNLREERHGMEWKTKTIHECASSEENSLSIPGAVFISIHMVGIPAWVVFVFVAFFVCLFVFLAPCHTLTL